MRINPYLADIHDYEKRQRGAMTEDAKKKLIDAVKDMKPTDTSQEALQKALHAGKRAKA